MTVLLAGPLLPATGGHFLIGHHDLGARFGDSGDHVHDRRDRNRLSADATKVQTAVGVP
jgi:hypothetical protein